MIRSPGTRRHCVAPVPEEVWLKISLLGLKMVWERNAWSVYPEGRGEVICVVSPLQIESWTWEAFLTYLADVVCKNKRVIGWTNTERVGSMPIEAASVIAENFDDQ